MVVLSHQVRPFSISKSLSLRKRGAVSGRLPNHFSALILLLFCYANNLDRDRVLALGMRRPHRLHQAPVENSAPSESDFGMEATSPSYFDFRTKQITMTAFIWFCKLSTIMEEMAVIQRKNKFAKDWSGTDVYDMVQGLQEANRTHMKLISWLTEFEGIMSETFKFESDQKVPISISSLRIIAQYVFMSPLLTAQRLTSPKALSAQLYTSRTYTSPKTIKH